MNLIMKEVCMLHWKHCLEKKVEKDKDLYFIVDGNALVDVIFSVFMEYIKNR